MDALSPSAALTELRRLSPEVEAAIIINANGGIEAMHAGDDLEGTIAPIMTTLTAMAERASMELGRGGLSRLVLDGTSGQLVAHDLGAGRVMAAVCAQGAPLGLLLDDISACADRLRA
ncbi:MAG: roadblock/LC7 domain-containing protein [Alphaproteobacteria bacterium]|nr:roadblock/LC7 domain-containing protein [Alphaproteobacteria bacterium]MCB9796611.1 roadblock/LC7 domain-containing protein [Alphaproteobacteria bacterium]